MLVDMDAFFAAVEILDNPQLQDKAVSVTNGIHGSTIITCSYVARHYGIHTGMSLHNARHLCPDLVNVAARHQRYNRLSREIMSYLSIQFTPDIEIFSVDEAFLDLTRCQMRFPHIHLLATAIQKGIYQRFGLHASIGVSGDKTTAKYAAQCAKPYGIKVIHPNQSADFLSTVAVTKLCGIAENTAYVLAEYGIYYCQDIHKVSKSILQQRLGIMGVRIWYMCQGKDPTPVYTQTTTPKTMGHGKVLPPRTDCSEKIHYYFAHMAAKLADRLQQEGYYSSVFLIGMRTTQRTWIKKTVRHVIRYHVYQTLVGIIHTFIAEHWHGDMITHVQITARRLHPIQQLDLLESLPYTKDIQGTITAINKKYQKIVVTYANIIEPIT